MGKNSWHVELWDKNGKTVAAWRDHLPQFLPLPHPSWRNTAWLKANPWFTTDLVPKPRRRIHTLLG